MIVDLIKFVIKPECLETAIIHMKTQTEQNRLDEGCVMSHVFQMNANHNELYMLLGWESPVAVEKHLATVHDAEFRVNMDDKLASTPIFLDWTMLI